MKRRHYSVLSYSNIGMGVTYLDQLDACAMSCIIFGCKMYYQLSNNFGILIPMV